jgi:succinate dehydrogenase/fumarate reductase-like Fe-S protein
MKQSKNTSEILQQHEDNAADSLLYWVNCTTTICGANFTVNLLLQAMKELLEKSVKPDQVDRVEEILTAEFVKTYDYIRAAMVEPTAVDEYENDTIPDEVPTTKLRKKVIH